MRLLNCNVEDDRRNRCKQEEAVHRNQVFGVGHDVFGITIKDTSEN